MNQPLSEMQKNEIAVSIILRRTGLCLAHLGTHILNLEQQVLGDRNQTDAGLHHTATLQSFDFLRQATDDIALMLARLADAVPSAPKVSRVDVIGSMTLQELRDAINVLDDVPLEELALFTGKTVEVF